MAGYCNNICIRIKYGRKGGSIWYDIKNNIKWCKTCNVLIQTTLIYCPCCNIKMRVGRKTSIKHRKNILI